MKSNHNDRRHEGYNGDRSNYKSYDDYNLLEPSPDIDLNFLDDDEDDLSDYSLMDNANILDYEE